MAERGPIRCVNLKGIDMLELYKTNYFKVEAYLHSFPNAWWVVFIVNTILLLLVGGLSFILVASLFGPVIGLLGGACLFVAIVRFSNPRNWKYGV